MTWLGAFLAEIVKWLLSALVTEARKPSTCEDGQASGELERRLRAKLGRDGWEGESSGDSSGPLSYV